MAAGHAFAVISVGTQYMFQVLKMYAWEPSFETQVARIREQEIGILTKAAYLDAASTFVCDCAPFLVSNKTLFQNTQRISLIFNTAELMT